MIRALYTAASGMSAQQLNLDTIANNLANSSTTGFRQLRLEFQDMLYQNLITPGAAQSQTTVSAGLQVGLGTRSAATEVIMTQGELNQTNNPLDLAIEGQGFFAVQTPAGVRYTRDGSFHRTRDGQLVSAAGEPVLSNRNQPIPLPPGEISIGADGAISVGGGTVAVVGVFSFPTGTQLTPEGKNRLVPPAKVQPTVSTSASIHQGALEAANEDVIQGSLDLILMQRQAETMQRALTIFHTEFNKTAAEDLPRV